MLAKFLDRWCQLPASDLSDHGSTCCQTAKAWLVAMDRSLHSGDTVDCPPTWIRVRFQWGPSRWPLFWCEAMRSEELDCGAIAAIARHVFGARRVLAITCQLVRRHSPQHVATWRERWIRAGCSADWASGDLTYHEGCAILTSGQLAIWDPTANAWLDPDARTGDGQLLAFRVGSGGCAAQLHAAGWGPFHVPLGCWVGIEGHNPPEAIPI